MSTLIHPLWTRLLAWLQGRPLAAGSLAAGVEVREPEHSLPAALHQRLREIPRRETLCRDVHRGWAELAREELPPEEARRLRNHLAGCERCTAVYAVLEAAVLEPPLPLPARLVFRLNGLGRGRAEEKPRRQRLALWIRDVRYAAAFSYLGALLVMFVLGNPVEAGARGVETVRPPVESFLTRAQDRVQSTSGAWWQALEHWQSEARSEARAEFERRQQKLADAQQQRWQHWQDQFDSLIREIRQLTDPADNPDGGSDGTDGGAAA